MGTQSLIIAMASASIVGAFAVGRWSRHPVDSRTRAPIVQTSLDSAQVVRSAIAALQARLTSDQRDALVVKCFLRVKDGFVVDLVPARVIVDSIQTFGGGGLVGIKNNGTVRVLLRYR
jgi:hypothetical protein